MSVTASEAGNGRAAWLSVSEAAMACRVSERTVRRWVSEGVVESRVETAGLRESRLILRGSLPASSAPDTGCQAMAAPSGTSQPATTGHGAADPGLNAPAPGLSELATVTARAQVAERERERADAEITFLREQLQSRTHAEAELRRLLLLAQQQAQALAAQLEQKALPAAPARRVRWWIWGRR